MESSFSLDPRLEESSILITTLSLSQIRLSLNATWPWIILIPRRANISEISDLCAADAHLLMNEICYCSQKLTSCVPCDKINVAALGNIVSQLHVHIVARRINDAQWPHPIWGSPHHSTYTAAQQTDMIALLQQILNESPPHSK